MLAKVCSAIPLRSRFYSTLCALVFCLLSTGCKTAPTSEESFVKPFEPQKVAELSHEAYRAAWDLNTWARHDLFFASFHPTTLDWDVVNYLDDISRMVPWIARKIEKHPDHPRAASWHTQKLVAYKTILLRTKYAPTSFRPSTQVKIERLLSLLDEISVYYEQKPTKTVYKTDHL